MTVTWKTKVWPQEYRIFRDRIIVGIMKKETWKRAAYGEYNGAMLQFKPEGFWNTGTIILDIEGKKELGRIEYNTWKSTGNIVFQAQKYSWKYESSWKRNKWSIVNEREQVNFEVTNIWKGEGSIEIEGLPAAMVVIGLFIHDYFETLTTAVIT